MKGNAEITVNGEPHVWRDQSVAELLADFDLPADRPGVAVALNAAVLPRGAWRDSRVKPGDRLEIVNIVKGG